jgi:hypothetical protein
MELKRKGEKLTQPQAAIRYQSTRIPYDQKPLTTKGASKCTYWCSLGL